MTTSDKIPENETRKRFIAGAVCPACQVMDGIRMWEVDGVPNRDCVHCGYSDTLNADGNSIPNELLRPNCKRAITSTASSRFQ